jgi:hypothetical protein
MFIFFPKPLILLIIVYEKQACSYTNSDVEHVCNTGTTPWNSEGRDRKRKC